MIFEFDTNEPKQICRPEIVRDRESFAINTRALLETSLVAYKHWMYSSTSDAVYKFNAASITLWTEQLEFEFVAHFHKRGEL